jgi:TctA family transporter
LIGIAASLLALLIFSRNRPWFDYVLVLFTGVFGLIGVLLIKPED